MKRNQVWFELSGISEKPKVWEIGSKRAFSRDTRKIITTNATHTNVKLPHIIDLSLEILPKMPFEASQALF